MSRYIDADAPTADVVEVVRCKDCKFCCKFFCRGNRYYCCGEFWVAVTEEDFCSRGERKDENEQAHDR